ncbi:MAG TPA: xanthine dehydrogenase family protein subunit M [Micropepsaceae bacterium]|nr:xanthine dehydrogenase family protein subunit M [Micropepsaceae bacterium]
MYEFEYLRPSTLADAERALRQHAGAKLLAGGQSLIPALKLRLNRVECLVDLSGIIGMNSIERRGSLLAIGAMVTHAEVAESSVVKKAIPGLAQLAADIGDPQVRNCGTIGGSIANNDPSADYPAAVLALGATLKTNKREIAAEDHFKGLFAGLGQDEILTEVLFPIPRCFGYAKFPNPASRFALAGAAVADTGKGVRVAATGAGMNGVFRVRELEAALSSAFRTEGLKKINIDSSNLISDVHGNAEYRAHLIGVMTKRAVDACLAG